MKKLLSLFLVICLLFVSMVVTSPVSAEEETADEIYTAKVIDESETTYLLRGKKYHIDVSEIYGTTDVRLSKLYGDLIVEDGYVYAETATDMSYLFAVDTSTGETLGTLKFKVLDPDPFPTGITLDKTSVTITDGTAGESYTHTQVTAKFTPDGTQYDKLYWSSDDESIATVSEGHIHAEGVGKTTVRVRSLHGEYSASCEVTVEPRLVYSVKISETEITVQEGNTYNYLLMAYITPTDVTNSTLVWSSDDESIARVEAIDSYRYKVYGISEGTTTIRATATDGSGRYGTCKVKVLSTRLQGINFPQNEYEFYLDGKRHNLNIEFNPEFAANKTVYYESSDPSVATVNIYGELYPVGYGQTTITATSEDGGHIATCTVNIVSAPITGLSFNTDKLTLKVGDKLNISNYVIFEPSYALRDVHYLVGDTSKLYVSCDQYGNVTALKAGKGELIVRTNDFKIKAYLPVEIVDVPAEGMTFENNNIKLAPGAQSELRVKFTPDNTTNKRVTFVSSNSEVVAVTASDDKTFAYMEGKKEGTATITATSEDGGFTASCTVTVENVPVLEINPHIPSRTVEIGSYVQIECDFYPENTTDKTLTYSSTDESVATVSADGVIYAVSPGRAYIIVTSPGSGLTGIVNVEVVLPGEDEEEEAEAYLEVTSITLEKGEIYAPSYSFNKNASDIYFWWISDDSTVVSSERGVFEAVGTGTTTLRLIYFYNDKQYEATCRVTVCESHPEPTPRVSVAPNYYGSFFPFVAYFNDIEAGKTVIVAHYKNNKLLYTESVEYRGQQLSTFYANSNSTTADCVKVFVWDSMGSLIPVCKAAAYK